MAAGATRVRTDCQNNLLKTASQSLKGYATLSEAAPMVCFCFIDISLLC